MQRRLTAAALAVTAAALTVAGPVAPALAVDNSCAGVDKNVPAQDTSLSSRSLDLLGVAGAQAVLERALDTGAVKPDKLPVRVAVLGSGVKAPSDGAFTVAESHSEVGEPEVLDPSATITAGLIAGAPRSDSKLVGIAPDAELVDVRVYADGRPGMDGPPPDADDLAAGLTWVADEASRLNIRIATVDFTLRSGGSALKKAVERVHDAGVVLVAPTGDRPEDDGSGTGDYLEPTDDEDGADDFYPAAYSHVVGVNATSDGDGEGDVVAHVVKNAQTTVAAPTFGAVSYGLNGATCVVDEVSTGPAAAEVSGVLALLAQMYPKDTAKQLVARLVNTATGTVDDPTPLVGAGVVQPYEALTRPLDPSDDGKVERTVTQAEAETQATAPERESDLLASTRENAVWWGLIGGGVLVVALLLRPVLARRRVTRS